MAYFSHTLIESGDNAGCYELTKHEGDDPSDKSLPPLPEGFTPHYMAKIYELADGHVEGAIIGLRAESVSDILEGRNPFAKRESVELDPEQREKRIQQNLKLSIQRTFRTIRHTLIMLKADHMVTFTTRGAMQDLDEFNEAYERCVRLFVKKYPNYAYCGVPELHPGDGVNHGGWHFHCGIYGKVDIKYLQYCWQKALGLDHETLTQWYIHGVPMGDKSMGTVNVQYKNTRWGKTNHRAEWRPQNLSGYLCKYLTKAVTEGVGKGKKRYWASKNIAKPVVRRVWLNAQSAGEGCAEFWKIAHGLTDDISKLGNVIDQHIKCHWFRGTRDKDSPKSLAFLDEYFTVGKVKQPDQSSPFRWLSTVDASDDIDF